MGSAHVWTIVDDIIPHTCVLGFELPVVKTKKFTPFTRKVLANGQNVQRNFAPNYRARSDAAPD